METYSVEDYKGYEIKIYRDEMGIDPREEFDYHIGTMVCFHPRYKLGDNHSYSPEGFTTELAIEVCPGIEDLLDYWNDGSGWGKFQSEEKSDAMIKKAVDAVVNKHYFLLPLYLYDHSGITISTSPFPCPWDSGMIGAIFATWEDLRKALGEDCTMEQALNALKAEVKQYDDYITGNVFGYVIEEDLLEESCWGYYGDPEKSGLLEDAKSMIDEAIKIDTERKEKMNVFMRTCWAH